MDITLRDYINGKVGEQEVLDFTFAKIQEQGQPSLYDGQCMYNGEGGMHCAIGWLIRNETGYTPKEGASYDRVLSKLELIASREQHYFLGALQEAHDNTVGPHFETTLIEQFDALAADFGLNPPA